MPKDTNPIKESVDFQVCLKEVLAEVLKPVGRLEYLKSKVTLSPKEVQELYGIPESTLRTWRCRGGGPDYIQPYKHGPVGYEHAAIKAFQNRGKIRVSGISDGK